MLILARIRETGGVRRVNLPTYEMKAETDDGEYAVISVPNDDVPRRMVSEEMRTVSAGGKEWSVFIPKMGILDEWKSQLSGRYLAQWVNWDGTSIL